MILTKVLRNKGNKLYHLRTTHQEKEYNIVLVDRGLNSFRAKVQLITYNKGKETFTFIRSGEIITFLTKEAIAFIKSN
jgi:hypothetical protein